MKWNRDAVVLEDQASLLPGSLAPLAQLARTARAEELTRYLPPDDGGRHSAVLVLFGSEPQTDVLLIRRSEELRSHGGQPAFPGGALEAADADATAAALREAQEETGLDPSGVRVFGWLPDLWVPVSNFVVTPVLAWWERPSAVAPSGEASSVHRVSIAELVDPVNRCSVRHQSGYVGPGFQVQGMLVWGFTGGLLSRLLDRVGWSLPWDADRVVDLPGAALT
jgi:8-oxo-dGTP pyrophosphatase MutT (NUDIX family)